MSEDADGMPHRMSVQLSERMPDQMPERMSGKDRTQSNPLRMSNQFLDRMPDRRPEHASAKMSEYTSAKMLDCMSIKCHIECQEERH